MGLSEDLRQLSEQVKKRQSFIKGEEATKQALILPFLQVLGYDIYDPTETQPEYVADFAKKRGGVLEKVDYALHLRGQPALFIECKAADVAPEDHDGQLARYFNATPSVRIAVVTNGIRYRFFTDLQSPNVMDASPFMEFNVLSFSERDVELLRPFTKEAFNSESIQQEIAQPNMQAVSPTPPTVQTPVEALQKTAAAVEPGASTQLETTEVELEIFQNVQRLCAESTSKQAISYKDSASYFGINLGKVTSWFIRAFTNGKRKSLVTRLPVEQASMLAPGFEVEAAPEAMGKSRVYFGAPTDIDKLRALVLVAYEDEVKRQQSAPAGDNGESPVEATST